MLIYLTEILEVPPSVTISCPTPQSVAENVSETLPRRFTSNRYMLQRFSIRGSLLLSPLVAATLLQAPSLHAQMHHVAPPEKVTRAIAVYEWTGDFAKPTAARLVPVSLFINGHLEDAGVYLTQPMPFALQSGDVYSVEEAGLSKGTLDISYARNVLTRRSATDDNPLTAWYGYGTFAPPAPPPKPHPLKADTNAATIVGSNDDDRPHFTGRQPGQPQADDTKPTSDSTDSNRPHMSRRTDTADTADSTGTGAIPDDDPDRPTLRHRDPVDETKKKKGKESESGVTPMDTSLNDDPDRPTMRRGIPLGTQPVAELTTLPPDLHQIAAVSDAANRDPHLFAREWQSTAEHTSTLSDLQTLAQQRIAKYLSTWHLTAPQLTIPNTTTNPGAPGPAFGTRASTSSNTNTSKSHVRFGPHSLQTLAPTPTLADEQLTPYTLSYGGLPTFVYTAQSPITTGGPVYITLVAQRLPSGELQVALSSVTDASHLDRTPWLRLVDAVDPDASHRASLLFELRAQTSRQFALYSLTTAKAEQQFATGIIE